MDLDPRYDGLDMLKRFNLVERSWPERAQLCSEESLLTVNKAP